MAQTASSSACLYAVVLTLALLVAGCSEQLDAGSTRPRGLLPVDERNPVILTNDGAFDNWVGEYAVLLANGGGSELAAIVVSASPAWPKLEDNIAGWRGLVDAARQSGLKNIPAPTPSFNSRLTVPSSGKIEDTAAERIRRRASDRGSFRQALASVPTGRDRHGWRVDRHRRRLSD